MLTTIRSSKSSYETGSYGGVDVLERKSHVDVSMPEKDETMEETRLRMRENLDRLLNYDRVSTVEYAPVEEEPVETKVEVQEIVNVSDEDIRPTSTTMQFGPDGKETVFKDMEREKESSSYKLNGKGKAVVILYALAVVVVLALIILNTGVLSVLSNMRSAKAATLAEKQEQVAAIYEKIEEVSSDEHVIKLAEEGLDMSFNG